MKPLSIALFIVLGALAPTAIAQQTHHIRATYKPVQNDDGTRGITITWVADFNAQSPSAVGVAPSPGCSNCPVTVKAAGIKTDFTKLNVGVATETTFTTTISYGAQGDVLNDTTESVDLTLKAIPTETGAAPVETTLSLSLEAVRAYFDLKTQNKNLATDLASRPPKALPAHLNVKEVTAVTDRTIKVRLNADQTIRVDVLAYQTKDVSQATGSTSFKTPDQLLPANEDKEITILQLTEDKDYVLKIKETSKASDPTARSLIEETLTGGPGGSALKTKKTIDLPTISAVGSPTQKRNDAVHVAFSAKNATSVLASVEAFNTRGEIYQVSKETPIPSKNDPADPTRYEGDIPVAAGIQENVTYRVRFRAVNTPDNLTSIGDDTNVFTGKSAKLFDVVELQITASTFRFIPTNASSTVQTKVSIALNQRAALSLNCNQPPSTSSPATSPVCEINVAAMLAALTPTPPTPGTTAPVATTSQPSKLTFLLTVTDPETERIQTSTFAISVTPPDTTTSKGKDMLNNVKSFVQSVVAPGGGSNNNALEPKKIQGTGIAGFLGALLRGFIAL